MADLETLEGNLSRAIAAAERAQAAVIVARQRLGLPVVQQVFTLAEVHAREHAARLEIIRLVGAVNDPAGEFAHMKNMKFGGGAAVTRALLAWDKTLRQADALMRGDAGASGDGNAEVIAMPSPEAIVSADRRRRGEEN